MNCYDAHAWLNALLDDELDTKLAGEMRAHLAQCEACTNRYRTLEALRGGLRRAGMHYDVPESLRRKVEAIASPMSSAMAANSAMAAGSGMRASSATEANSRTEASSATENAAAPAPGPGAPSEHGRLPWSAGVREAAIARPFASIARWLAWAGWPVAIAASALLAVNLGEPREDFQSEVVAAHVRSLLVDHLNDVVSSDHHTVKPWFAGKLDFSPPVPDLAAQGFELIGGRLEYLDHQLAAAIVYRRHAHVINLLVRRENARTPSAQRASVHNGYALREWRASGLDFIAISDVEPTELEIFQRAYALQQMPK